MGLLLFWNVVSLVFMGTEGLIIQLMLVVLYSSLVMLGFMLYSNSGGSVLVLVIVIMFVFLSSAIDVSVYALMVVLVLLVVVL